MGSSWAPWESARRPILLGGLPLLVALSLAGCPGPTPITRTGRVVGTDGTPVAGATVSAPDTSAVTDARGRWALATGHATLEIRKPGFKAASAPATQPEVRLESSGKPISVVWDDRWSSPPSEGIRTWLSAQGAALRTVTAGQRVLPADVVVLASPAFSSYDALAELHAAVRQGATLLLAGEWGGYPGVDLAALNDLAAPAGIRFDGSLIRDLAAAPGSDRFTPTFSLPGAGLSEPATFAGSGALSAVPPALILASSGTASYRVSNWSRGPQIVAAYGPAGAGKVVAVADSSWLADAKSLGAGTPNWQVGGNPALALALVRF